MDDTRDQVRLQCISKFKSFLVERILCYTFYFIRNAACLLRICVFVFPFSPQPAVLCLPWLGLIIYFRGRPCMSSIISFPLLFFSFPSGYSTVSKHWINARAWKDSNEWMRFSFFFSGFSFSRDVSAQHSTNGLNEWVGGSTMRESSSMSYEWWRLDWCVHLQIMPFVQLVACIRRSFAWGVMLLCVWLEDVSGFARVDRRSER